jgi:SAM-dependent methyltransferase
MTSNAVLWHDLECGGYAEDLPLWQELAAAAGGPVLDIGAGTGRVTLDLAARGHEVVALDADGELLAALAERAGDLPVHTVRADARDFHLGRRFALVLIPMQTVQLLGGPRGRAAFLRCARAHLAAGGVLAAALADALEGFDAEHDQPPLPDVREVEGTVYASRPVAVRDTGAGVVIERIREIIDRAPRGGGRRDHPGPARRRDAGRRGRSGGARGAGAASRPGHRRVRRIDRGDAAWLTGRCASARCTPTC